MGERPLAQLAHILALPMPRSVDDCGFATWVATSARRVGGCRRRARVPGVLSGERALRSKADKAQDRVQLDRVGSHPVLSVVVLQDGDAGDARSCARSLGASGGRRRARPNIRPHPGGAAHPRLPPPTHLCRARVAGALQVQRRRWVTLGFRFGLNPHESLAQSRDCSGLSLLFAWQRQEQPEGQQQCAAWRRLAQRPSPCKVACLQGFSHGP
jgi:hypothetical protein